MIDVAVIGGGISGLTAAHELRRQGHNVMVLERQVRSGGNAISENIGGFLMEHGPSTTNAALPEVGDLSGALGLNTSLVDLSDKVKRRYLVKGGELAGISIHPLGFFLSSYLSPAGRLRLMAELAVPKQHKDTDETVDQYFTRRFGSEFSTRVMDPLVGGLYAGRADELSVESVFPKLVNMENRHGSICRAVLSRHLRGRLMPSRRLSSWSKGIGSLPAALSRALSGDIRTGIAVRDVRVRGAGFEIDTHNGGKVAARAVLVATQSHVAAVLLERVSPDGAEAISEISAPPLAVVFMGYKRKAVDHPLDGLGYLAPSSENRVLTGVQFPSSMFPGRAPEGYVSMTGYLGGARYPGVAQLTEDDLAALAKEEFKDLLGARGCPEVSRVRCWPRGIPQYQVGHQSRLQKIQEISNDVPGLFVTGNYLAGPSVGACVSSALEAAEDISTHLSSGRPVDKALTGMVR